GAGGTRACARGADGCGRTARGQAAGRRGAGALCGRPGAPPRVSACNPIAEAADRPEHAPAAKSHCGNQAEAGDELEDGLKPVRFSGTFWRSRVLFTHMAPPKSGHAWSGRAHVTAPGIAERIAIGLTAASVV